MSSRSVWALSFVVLLLDPSSQQQRYYLRPGEGRQLRLSVDTEVGYSDRREAKRGVSARGDAIKGDDGVEFSAAGRPELGTTPVVGPPPA